MIASTNDSKRFTIRMARATDLGAIEELLTASELPTTGVKDALGGFMVAESDNRLVGVVGMERCGRYGLLRSTAVSAEWRGRGVAKELVERVIANAERKGVQALYLLTTTAEQYFPSFGFRVTSRDVVPDEIRNTCEFSETCCASATVMSLPLADAG
jgi:amino-acid N-acetyltransferase